MKYAAQYVRSAAAILEQYDGSFPLAAFLKQYFKTNTKFGSKDRRFISQLCYTYFRTGHALKGTTEEKIRAAVFLCGLSIDDWGVLFAAGWLEAWSTDLENKWQIIIKEMPGSDPANIFPWKSELSESIDTTAFSNAHLVQPDLFLRIRPERKKGVLQKLAEQDIPFVQVSENCLSLPNATKIDTVLSVDKEVVIQDLSSQKVEAFINLVNDDSRITKTVWDCCAASGGKSLLACDTIKNIQLTVSDVRPSILRNLKERFETAAIKNYDSFVADLSAKANMPSAKYKLVICDAPCSGSGTWGRTPEQLYFFTEDKIDTYAALQQKITNNVIDHVEKDGYLLYITCSVFKKENENIVGSILKHPGTELVKMGLIKGYDKKADTMFAALVKIK